LSRKALLLSLRDGLRANWSALGLPGDGAKSCHLATPPGRPHPRCGHAFAAVWCPGTAAARGHAGWSLGQEAQAVVTLTWRSAYAPDDRRGDELAARVYDAADAVAGFLHKDSMNNHLTGPAGYHVGLRFLHDRAREVDGRWFGAAEADGKAAGVVVDLYAGGAVKVRNLDNETG
jgi:hypothetical protein